MHAQISAEHLDNLIERVDRGITRNLEFVSDNNYAEASGYARGALLQIQRQLLELKNSSMYSDVWDDLPDLSQEIEDCPPVPAFPSIWKHEQEISRA